MQHELKMNLCQQDTQSWGNTTRKLLCQTLHQVEKSNAKTFRIKLIKLLKLQIKIFRREDSYTITEEEGKSMRNLLFKNYQALVCKGRKNLYPYRKEKHAFKININIAKFMSWTKTEGFREK